MRLIAQILFLFLFCSLQSFAQEAEVETICSKRCGFCFQIPSNHFMLATGDIETSLTTYETIDKKGRIEIIRNPMERNDNLFSLFQRVIDKWTSNNCRLTLKREENDYFIVSGYINEHTGFYQKVIKLDDEYCSLYLEFPKGDKKYAWISQLIFDHFKQASS